MRVIVARPSHALMPPGSKPNQTVDLPVHEAKQLIRDGAARPAPALRPPARPTPTPQPYPGPRVPATEGESQ